jgi:hypothetical protein
MAYFVISRFAVFLAQYYTDILPKFCRLLVFLASLNFDVVQVNKFCGVPGIANTVVVHKAWLIKKTLQKG